MATKMICKILREKATYYYLKNTSILLKYNIIYKNFIPNTYNTFEVL